MTGHLIVSRGLLEVTLGGLRDRSAGWRESGAVWVGKVEDNEREWRAEGVRFHHELGEDQAGPLNLELSEAGKFRLYQEANRAGLRLIALLHTHPEEWVGLSAVDQRNQLCPRLGFWSIVVPHYGREPWAIEALGIHRRVATGWWRLPTGQAKHRLIIEE